MTRKKTDAERLEMLLSRLKWSASGCWEYQGPRRDDGYGIFVYRHAKLAHRAMYLLSGGDIPAGMVVMHTCDNTSCCNPGHLKLGTKADNNRDMFSKRRHGYSSAHYTHCKNNHEFTAENTWVDGKGFRHCRRCALIKGRLAAGWPKELAETLPPTPKGYRPVNGSFKTRIKADTSNRIFSTRGSAPRQRAWRARQKAKREATSQVE